MTDKIIKRNDSGKQKPEAIDRPRFQPASAY
jgi:hypothetical protein